MSDEGFLKKIFINLLSISLIIAASFTSPRLQTPVVYLYNFVIDRMLDIAHRNAWWFLLATLSSSCCVLQLLLNTLSVGCAGFNTVLGPLRPTLLAIGILSQGMSWYVMLRVARNPQWIVTVGSSLLMVVMSLLPEILDLYTKRRKVIINNNSGLVNNSMRKECTVSNNDGDAIDVLYDMGTSVGCSACVNKISDILDGMSCVLKYNVSLDDNRLKIHCRAGTDSAIILEKLKNGGYGMIEVVDR